MCIMAYILGACKVSLQQVRYTFRHDTVLHKIIKSLKSFILSIKQAAPISPKSSFKSVKMGTKVPGKRTSPVGILHQTSDWVLLLDLGSNPHDFHSAKIWYYKFANVVLKDCTHWNQGTVLRSISI